MKDYREEQAERNKRFWKLKETEHLTGIACPKCKENGWEVELHFTGMTLLSYPSQAEVICPKCNFIGGI